MDFGGPLVSRYIFMDSKHFIFSDVRKIIETFSPTLKVVPPLILKEIKTFGGGLKSTSN